MVDNEPKALPVHNLTRAMHSDGIILHARLLMKIVLPLDLTHLLEPKTCPPANQYQNHGNGRRPIHE
jgi:hypothetical protein